MMELDALRREVSSRLAASSVHEMFPRRIVLLLKDGSCNEVEGYY